MWGYIIRRLLISLPLLLGATFITFVFIQIAPGDYLDNLRLNPQISPQTIKLYQEKFNLDKPLLIQYFSWLRNILRLDFGYSFSYNTKVSKIISSRAFNTFLLSFFSIVLTWLVVIPLGVLSALKRNTFIDRGLSFLSYIGISTPGFFLALLLLYFVSKGDFLPLGGMRSVNYYDLGKGAKFIDILRHLILPSFVLAAGSVGSLLRIMRSNMLEVLGSQFILAARAKGLTRRRILFVHALRNALNPMITIFGYQFSSLLSGAALVEIVVGWPGLGRVMLHASRAQDLYLVMGGVLVGGVLLILGNLIADILLALFDPRIRYQ